MSLTRYIRSLFLVGMILFFGMLHVAQPVIAQEEASLQLSPAIIDVNGLIGKRVDSTIKLTNISDKPLAIASNTRSLTPEDTPIDQSAVERYDASLWITIPTKSYLLAPNSSTDVPIQVNIPIDAVPGGHYGLVVFRIINDVDSDSTGVRVNSEAAAVVLISVPGDITEKLELSEISSSHYSFGNKLEFSQEVMNTGNTHVTPIVTTQLLDNDGNVVDSVAQPVQLLLPNTKRDIMVKLSSSGFGKHRVRTIVSYGTPTQTVASETLEVFMLPSIQKLAFWTIVVLVSAVIMNRKLRQRKLTNDDIKSTKKLDK